MREALQTGSRIIICRGARAAERRLFEVIEENGASDLEALERPIRIVVPSKSLRRHLLRTIARRRGAVAGLQVQTLFGFALEVLTRSGRSVPPGDAVFELVVRRLAAADPALNESLGGLRDGYDPVVGAVRDLLDAGFEPGHLEGVLESLDDVARDLAPGRVERTRAVVRLAAMVCELGEDPGPARSMQALQWAGESLAKNGPSVAPTRHLFVHGFADVTGVAADLLAAAVRVFDTTVLLDRPPDPANREADDLGGVYLSRLEERLTHLGRETDLRLESPPRLVLVEAPDREAEARWVAEEIRGLLENGVTPEEIGVVGRTLDGLVLPLRRHLRRLGVPFSGIGAGVPGASPRHTILRLLELLRQGPSCGADLWMEACAGEGGTTELLLGLRVLGVLRLSDLAALRAGAVPSNGVRLPVDLGPDEDGEEPGTARRLSAEVLREAVARAGRVVSALDRRPEKGPAAVHRRHTLALLDALGWGEESPGRAEVQEALERICREVPDDLMVTAAEWQRLLGDRMQKIGEVAIGGEGAGVQVLTVMEARSRTFSHLFVMACNRRLFPRVVHEDPMLPEAVRTRLAATVLPEMPVKGRSADEERYLFAQLVSSSPSVHLSWSGFGPDGTMTASPFVDRLRLRTGAGEPMRAPQLWSQEAGRDHPRTAYELAILAAPRADSNVLKRLLEAAVDEGRMDAASTVATVSPVAVAAARLSVLEAVERPRDAAISPWFGFTGAGRGDAGQPLWVTHAEGTGTCPWREFVEHGLGVFPMPDPLLGLPGIDGPLVGQVVHGVLDQIVDRGIADPERVGAARLDELAGGRLVTVVWPDEAVFEEILAATASRVAERAGLGPVGMAPLLAARARGYLEVERELEWTGGALSGVLGSEVEGAAEIPGVDRKLAFRADRVDGLGGAIKLVDYKASQPVSDAKKEVTRRKHIETSIARGRRLQAVAYASAAGVESARGAYLFLKPNEEWAEEVRVLALGGDDEKAAELFENAVQTIDRARESGIAFPRLEEADGKSAGHCLYCAVAEACRRDDSAFRRDLVRWMGASNECGVAADAARDLWWLGFERPEVDG